MTRCPQQPVVVATRGPCHAAAQECFYPFRHEKGVLSPHGALGLSKSSGQYLLKHAHAALLLWLIPRVRSPCRLTRPPRYRNCRLGIPLPRRFGDKRWRRGLWERLLFPRAHQEGLHLLLRKPERPERPEHLRSYKTFVFAELTVALLSVVVSLDTTTIGRQLASAAAFRSPRRAT